MVRYFGTERHTAENIAKALQNILSDYGIDDSYATATTDNSAIVVAALSL